MGEARGTLLQGQRLAGARIGRMFLWQLPPTLILHGDADPVVPVAEAYSLQKALEERKVA